MKNLYRLSLALLLSVGVGGFASNVCAAAESFRQAMPEQPREAVGVDCPACTFINEPGAAKCAICEKPCMAGPDHRAEARRLSKEELIGYIAPLIVGQLKREMEDLFKHESSSDAVRLARKSHERSMENTINAFGDTEEGLAVINQMGQKAEALLNDYEKFMKSNVIKPQQLPAHLRY